MSDNYPPGCQESDLPGCSASAMRYEMWYEDNEDRLLGEFLDGIAEEWGKGAPETEVRNWTKAIQKDFDDYVYSCWEDEGDSD